MKFKRIIVLLLVGLFIASCGGEKGTEMKKTEWKKLSSKEAEAKADSVLKLMTLEEKIAYTGGEKIFFIRGIERLGLKPIFFSDATQGIHNRKEFGEHDLSDRYMKKTTGFPSAIALASTWNKNLAHNYAKSIGEECRAGGISVLLGPGMNIYRTSQCGRNFEYFGEDPYLAGRMIENYVTGVQSTGTVATVKHFVANNTDFFRRKSNSIVDERTLQEIYMPAFKSGIDAGAKAAMTAYNLINGEWCGESEYVINYLLKDQLGFTGLVMTDWWSVYDGEKVAKSGQDLEMPYTIALENAQELLDEGKISETDIDRMVKSILKTCFEMKLYDREIEPAWYDTFPQHVETALQTAREGIVMLRNENNILPIKPEVKNILVTGDYVAEALNGGGSGEVKGYDNVTMLQALKNEFGDRINFVQNATIDEIKSADIVICNIGTADSEGYDRPFELPEDQEKRVLECVDNNKNTVVVVTSGSGIRMTDWNEKAGAILYSWYLGQIGNEAIAEILSGKTNPSGKLPMTIEREFKDSPSYGYMKGEDFYVGWNDEGEKAHPVYDLKYDEGVLVGYRWYETKKIESLYPFGAGFSYSNFSISDVEVSKNKFTDDDNVTVSFTIKNTSEIKGTEVVQLYVEDIKASVVRPVKELKGFEKTTLKPGESKQVEITLDKSAFSFWNPETKEWYAEKGEFVLHLGTSSKDIVAKKEVTLL